MKKHWIGKVFLFVLAVVGFSALAGLAVMFLWNWLMPALFGLVTINFCQALGLFALAKILFGFGGGGMRGGQRGGPWGRRFRARWENMSEEEKAKYRRCGKGFNQTSTEETTGN